MWAERSSAEQEEGELRYKSTVRPHVGVRAIMVARNYRKFSWGSQRVPRLAPAAQQFATTTLSTGGGNILKALFTVLAKHCATNYRAGRTPIRGPARVVLLPAKDCSSVDGYFRDEISMATHAGAACDASLHVR